MPFLRETKITIEIDGVRAAWAWVRHHEALGATVVTEPTKNTADNWFATVMYREGIQDDEELGIDYDFGAAPGS